MTHYLKTWPKYFQAVKNGNKTFELRKNDRNFQLHDDLVLQEYDPETGEFSKEELQYKISYILYLGDYLKSHTDYVVLGLR